MASFLPAFHRCFVASAFVALANAYLNNVIKQVAEKLVIEWVDRSLAKKGGIKRLVSTKNGADKPLAFGISTKRDK